MLDKSVYQNIDNLIEFDDDLRSAIIKAMHNKYLSMHKSAVWFDEGKQLHCTKLGGKNKTSKTIEGLNKKIIDYYKSFDLSFRTVMIEQLDNNLKLKLANKCQAIFEKNWIVKKGNFNKHHSR